uniref:Uncharacterized protein n=1 Tax=Rhizophora mucronata TaxID=61149 RepID=A0A2P2QEG5_RHIMU
MALWCTLLHQLKFSVSSPPYMHGLILPTV